MVSQIIGLRIVTRELSASELTVASVLVCALCGLSLGAFIAGRIADRKQFEHPSGEPTVRKRTDTLSLANFLLGFASLAVLLLALWGRDFASWLGGFGGDSVYVFSFLLATVFPINVLLGGIVPVLTKAALLKPTDNVQTAFGWIYAWETLGAAIGSCVVVFLAVPTIGTRNSLLIAASIVFVWTVVGVFSGSKRKHPEYSESEVEEPFAAADSNHPTENPVRLRWLLLLTALASSCASLGMELVWQRYFAVVFGSDSHSYAVVATVFLVGNSIGASLASRMVRVRSAIRILYQWQLLLVGGAILLSIWSLAVWLRIETLQWTLGWLEEHPLLGRMGMAVAVLLLPAVVIGTALPVLVKIWSAGQDSLGKKTGEIYACVIGGNVVGILACAGWLIPTFGLQLTAIILATICVAASVGFYFIATFRAPKRRSIGGWLLSIGYWIAIVGLGCLAFFIAKSPTRPGLSESGEWVVDHYVEQASHTVAVMHAKDTPTHKRLIIDGVTIGESGGGVDEKQQVLAHLPFVIGDVKRPNVLTIGLGTGILAGELAANEQVESVTCVELSSAVIDAARWFADENRDVLDDQKFDLVHGDGVQYLRNSKTDFDVIVSDGKSRPGAASNLPFFSEEYYHICSEALSENGVFVQWVSLRCDQRELETILRTFCGKFPFGHVAIAAPDSAYLVGTRAPISFMPAAIKGYLKGQSTETLRSYGWADTDDFLSMYWLDQTVVENVLSDVVPNTFDRPVLENFAWASYQHSVSQQPTQLSMLKQLLERDELKILNGQPAADSESQQIAELISKGRQAATELIAGELIRFEGQEDWLDNATTHFKKAIELMPNMHRQLHVVDDFRRLAAEAKSTQNVSVEFSALLNMSELNGTTATDETRLANILAGQNRGDLALQHYFRAVELSDQHPRYLLAFGEALLQQKRYSAALRQFEKAMNSPLTSREDSSANDDLKPLAKMLKGIALLKLRRAEGQKIVDEVLKERPDLQEVYLRFQY